MKYLLKDFSGGLITDNDTVDMPKNTFQKLMNWIVRPGKITRRKACTNFITAGLTAVKSFAEFKLFGSAEERFMVVKDGTGLEKHDYSGGTYSLGTIQANGYGGTLAAGDTMFFKSINNSVRGGAWSGWKDYAATTWWMGYIDRDYFNDAYSPTGGWYAEDARIEPPVHSPGNAFAYAQTKPGTRARSFTLAEYEDYRIRITYEYDGYQESWYKDYDNDNQDNVEITGDDEDYISIDFTLDETKINKRITAFNVYVARAADKDIKPYTAYYHVGRIGINDANFVDGGTTHTISLRIRRESSGVYPAGYVSSLDDFTTILLNNFVEELYIRNNAVTSVLGFDLHGYTNSLWMNQRNFVIRPALKWGSDDLPYDVRQVVLFSQVDKPDIFHTNIDFMDFSTKEGDACTGLSELWGNLIILKERNMFKVRFNNSGNSLSWEIDEHFQKVGMIAENSLAVGDGKVFFLGQDNVYMFDGNNAVSITKDKIKDELITAVNSSQGDFNDYEHIYGEYDPINKLYYLMLQTTTLTHCYLYAVDEKRWMYQKYNDADYLVAGLELGVDYDLLSKTTSTKIFKVDSSVGAGAEGIDVEMETQWLSLNDNQFQSKRINQLKIVSLNSHTFSMKIYKDYSVTASYTDTISTQTPLTGIEFNETSLEGKVFKIEIITTGNDLEGNNTLNVFEIEIDYDVLDER